jgi:hypothetical protein
VKSTEIMPGPGTYSPRQIDKPNVPSISMGIRTHTAGSRTSDTPGPGQYLKTDPGTSGSKFCKIGTEERKPLLDNTETPGPAAYSIIVKTGGPKYSLHGIKDFPSNEKIPGPGEYNPKSIT